MDNNLILGGSEAASKSSRTSKPKVKTGCNNCKQRRIKCDEKRPCCSQCLRFKRICTGYPPPQRSARAFEVVALQPRSHATLLTSHPKGGLGEQATIKKSDHVTPPKLRSQMAQLRKTLHLHRFHIPPALLKSPIPRSPTSSSEAWSYAESILATAPESRGQIAHPSTLLTINACPPFPFVERCRLPGCWDVKVEDFLAHVMEMHWRPFVCVFRPVGCTSAFYHKSAWLQHLYYDHVALEYPPSDQNPFTLPRPLLLLEASLSILCAEDGKASSVSEASSADATTEDWSDGISTENTSDSSERDIDRTKTKMVEMVILDVMQWLRCASAQLRAANGGAASGTAAPHESTADTAARTTGRKRLRARTEQHGPKDADESEDERDEPCPKRGKGKEKSIDDEKRRLACPYFKHDPRKYRAWNTCCGPGWSSTHRVKEHLYRRHRQPRFRCPRCWERFDIKQGLGDHLRSAKQCPIREEEPVDGFDETQELRLKSRKKPRNTSRTGNVENKMEVDKWVETYQILFGPVPLELVPSPYYEFNDLAEAEAGQSTWTEYGEYLARELPPRLRRELERDLERDLNIVEEGLKRKAVDLVKSLARELFRDFQHSLQSTGAPSRRLFEDGSPSCSSFNPQLTSRTESCSNFRGETFPQDFSDEDGGNFAWLDSLGSFAMLGDEDIAVGSGNFLDYILEGTGTDGQAGPERWFADETTELSELQPDHGMDLHAGLGWSLPVDRDIAARVNGGSFWQGT